MRGHLPAPHHGRMDPGPTRHTIRINGTTAPLCCRPSPLWPRGGTTRLPHADAVPTTALAVVTELFAAQARDVIYWYFNEVPKLTDEVGVAEAEKLAASAQGGH
jgi:hypothetical protein